MTATVTKFPGAGGGGAPPAPPTDGTQETRPPLENSPVRPLGTEDDRCWLVSAVGERRSVSKDQLAQGRGVFDLFAGGDVNGRPVAEWLSPFFPPLRERERPEGAPPPWCEKSAGRWLIEECVALGRYDPVDNPIRKTGAWRDHDASGAPIAVVHCGDGVLISGAPPERAGQGDFGVRYTLSGRGEFPTFRALKRLRAIDDDAASIRAELAELVEEIRDGWRWDREADAWTLLGWLGCALLGEFPDWRAHLYINGAFGSGKTTLVEMLNDLCGPMTPRRIMKGTSATAAGFRKTRNHQARPVIYDEFEVDDKNHSKLMDVITLLRTMSGGGEDTFHGTGVGGTRYELHGAACLASILPLQIPPQDRSRFVMLRIRKRKTDDPKGSARRLASLRARVDRLAPLLWRYAIHRAPAWDATFAAYRMLVLEMGGADRDADTIGAILAGHDLLLSDLDAPDNDALEAAREIAEPLIKAALEAKEVSEGQLCLNRMLQANVKFGGGEVRQIARTIYEAFKNPDRHTKPHDQLGRLGMKVHPEYSDRKFPGQQRVLLMTKDTHTLLNSEVFGAKSRWANGGHVAALCELDAIQLSAKNNRLPGDPRKKSGRVLVIPECYLPNLNDWYGDD